MQNEVLWAHTNFLNINGSSNSYVLNTMLFEGMQLSLIILIIILNEIMFSSTEHKFTSIENKFSFHSDSCSV